MKIAGTRCVDPQNTSTAKPTRPPEPSKPGALGPTPQPADQIPSDIERALKDGGVSLNPNGGSVTGNGWTVDSNGNVGRSDAG